MGYFIGLLLLLRAVVTITLLVLVFRALIKYLKSTDQTQEVIHLRKSLGETLKEYRETSKMTQEFVAEAIGVSRQAVSKWERGISEPSTTNLIAIARLYGISVEVLLRDLK